MVAQKECEYHYWEEKQDSPGSNRRPVRQARAQLRGNVGRCGLSFPQCHDQRKSVLIPSGDEAEHGGRCDTGCGLRQHYLEERFHARIPINQRRFLILLRNLIDKTFHHPNREREIERRVENDQSDMGIDQRNGAIHEVHRDSHYHWRQHAGGKNKKQPVRLTRHFEAGKSISGHRSHSYGQKSARYRDDKAIGEPTNITGAYDVTLIVSNKALASVHDELFPPRCLGIVLLVRGASSFHPCREELDESSDLRLEEHG